MPGTYYGEKMEAGMEGTEGAKEQIIEKGQLVWETHHVGSCKN